LVAFHGIRGFEPVPICLHELVPDDDHPAKGWREGLAGYLLGRHWDERSQTPLEFRAQRLRRLLLREAPKPTTVFRTVALPRFSSSVQTSRTSSLKNRCSKIVFAFLEWIKPFLLGYNRCCSERVPHSCSPNCSPTAVRIGRKRTRVGGHGCT